MRGKISKIEQRFVPKIQALLSYRKGFFYAFLVIFLDEWFGKNLTFNHKIQKAMKLATTLLHSIPTDPLTGAISVPIYQTSTFVQEAPGVNQGFDYARSNNPTRKVLEDLVAVLEGGSNGYAFAS